MDDENKQVTIFDSELIWAFFAVGAFTIAILLRFVWGPGGYMVDQFGYQRWYVLIAAAFFGFGLGWLLFPRNLPIMHSDEES